MGIVYQAFDSLLQRQVAIKMLPEDGRTSPEAVKRFLREGQGAAKLNHPNVVAVYDIGEAQGKQFIVMELVNGGSAQDYLRTKGRFRWQEATQILIDVCRGVSAAHKAGLIHRDIKPANILRSQEGVVKLGDFGLVKSAGRKGTVVTLVDAVIGTPHYMSPEQGQGSRVDERSDIYSLGATYYALLTGRPPFPGSDSVQVLFAHTSRGIPDPRDVIEDIPDGCAAIIRRAMAKNRAQRYTDADSLLTELLAIVNAPAELSASDSQTAANSFAWCKPDALDATNPFSIAMAYPAESTKAVSPRKWLGSRAINVSIASFVFAVVASAFLFVGRGGPAAPQDDWPSRAAAGENAIRNRQPGEMKNAAIAIQVLQKRTSVEGERTAMAHLTSRLEKAAAFRESITEKGLVLGTSGLVSGVAFTLDDHLLAAANAWGDGGVLVFDSWTGEKLTTLAPRRNNTITQVHAIAFSPDGKTLAAATGNTNGAKLYQIDTGAEKTLPLDKSVSRVVTLAFSPTKRMLVAGLEPVGEGFGKPYLKSWNIDTGRDAFAFKMEHRGKVAAVTFSAAGHQVVSGGRDKRVIMWDAETGRIWRELRTEMSILAIACSPRGGTLAAAGLNGDVPTLQIWDYAGEKMLDSKRLSGVCRCLAYSGDGSHLAGGCGSDVVIWNAETGAAVATFKGHSQEVASLAFAGKGGILATGSSDQTLRLWDVTRLLPAQP